VLDFLDAVVVLLGLWQRGALLEATSQGPGWRRRSVLAARSVTARIAPNAISSPRAATCRR
jgi:hypothetical protein